ncbi:hypothetical protein SPONN_1229 [uncultured Candidatus Thioglobus sp.]|nr:hypothetical protein SPONN_1229 [uncultured Candidatus Thioglobus sp.]
MNPLVVVIGLGIGINYLIKKLRGKKMNFEIDFLPVGNGDTSGDAIAVRYCEDGTNDYKIMVIDGGTKDSGQALVDHIKKYYETDYVDYVVNTHPDQDHASGLSIVMEQLEVGELWIHRPWLYVDEIIHHFKDQRMTEESLERRLKEKFSSSYALEELAEEKGVDIFEPYQGKQIGEFGVMSPSKNWYLHTLIPDFNKTPDKKAAVESIFEKALNAIKSVFESLSTETLKEDGETSADNESSVILYTEFNNKGIMFTGDAGIQALNKAIDYYDMNSVVLSDAISEKIGFIQVPHHGSRRNVSPDVLDKLLGNKGQLENKIAFVSAGKDSTVHPRKVVVNAFIRRGCKVCATQKNLIYHYHNMPDRESWSSITPLEFSNEVEGYD